jgi:beta-galactosidase
MSTAETFTLLRAAIADPQLTGVGRLPMRPALVPCPDTATARTGDPADSPWWRSLDGPWDLRMFEHLDELPASIVAERDGTWGSVQVPCAWTTQRGADGERLLSPHYTNVVMPFDADPPTVPERNPVGVHRRLVSVPADWKGRRIVLRVGAAESVVAAYVEGACVGVGTDSRLPNEFDITSLVRPGRRALVVLVVARWSAATWVEDQDQWWHGGIQRSVTMYATAPSHLARVTALPGLEDTSTDVEADLGTGTLDLELVVDGPARREDGWSVEVQVEALARGGRSGRVLARTGALAVPVWRSGNEVEQLLSAMFVEPGVVRHRLVVPGIRPWHHESPARYRVLATLRDPDGDVVEVDSWCTGFRSVRVEGNELLINGRPVLIHGVNLHEHDPERGRAVGAELTRRDLVLMKAHNLNAVRAAHYPHDEHLAELCDELGLYLVDEANVESHGRQTSLCHDPRYATTMVERVQRMVRRDANHPSIVMWSLGNESGDGPPHAAAAAWVRSVDPTRPLHYEGPLMHDLYADAPVTDVVCPMYAPIDDVVAWARSGRDTRRPLILCEYSHAMGNSNGSLADYWEAFETTHGLQGGFIWEWLEHGLERDGQVGAGPGGRVSWGYGGDFGDHPNDTNFVCDGLVAADRTPHPAMREVHHLGRPVRVTWADDRRRRLRVQNRRWFSGIDDLRATWELTVDGSVVGHGDLDVPPVGPRGEVLVGLPCRVPRTREGAEVHLTLRWFLRRATAWCSAAHEVGHDQLTLEAITRARSPRPVPMPQPVAERAVDVAALPWSPTLFRALTDNDGLRHGWMRGLLGNLARWVDEQGLDRCEWQADSPSRRRVDDAVSWTTSGRLLAPGVAEPVQVRRRLLVRNDGWTQATVTMTVPDALVDPPRVGTEWVLPAELSRVEWFGDGPHECYPDRRAATLVGRHTSAVEDLYEDYVVPQEHGQRTGVRWLALSGAGSAAARRSGLLVVADPATGDGTFATAVRRHSDAELWSCAHTDELARLEADRPPATYLYLDAAQRGLGTGSCGPDALERYRIAAGRHVLSVWFASYDPTQQDPAELARTVRAGG